MSIHALFVRSGFHLTTWDAPSDNRRSLDLTLTSSDRFTADEEKRFLTGVDANKQEALRRLHVTAVRTQKTFHTYSIEFIL